MKMLNLTLKELRLIAKIETSMATKVCLKIRETERAFLIQKKGNQQKSL